MTAEDTLPVDPAGMPAGVPAEADAARIDEGWQPLPARARTLLTIGALVRSAFIALPALVPIGLLGRSTAWSVPLALAVLIVIPALMVWSARRRFAHTRWRIDDQGFALRRGHLWHTDTRVPGSRVQHLDITRGPIERRFDLSTLVIHTAGTRHSAVSVSGLDTACAERLRDQLAQRIETDDDDD